MPVPNLTPSDLTPVLQQIAYALERLAIARGYAERYRLVLPAGRQEAEANE